MDSVDRENRGKNPKESSKNDTTDAKKEAHRLVALHSLGLLDSSPNPALDGIVKAAAGLYDASMALITLVDGDRQWFKASYDPSAALGDTRQTPREVAFCDRTIRSEALMLIPDASLDLSFQSNPLVTSSPNLRFYAGSPLKTSDGALIGALCVLDTESKAASPEQNEALARLSGVVVDLLVAEASAKVSMPIAESPTAAGAMSRILHEASHLLATEGAAGFSVRKVAKASNISLGHLQHYYGDRKTLMLAILESVTVSVDLYLQETIATLPNANDRIIAVAQHVLDQGAVEQSFRLTREFWAMSARDPAIAEGIRELNNTALRFFKKTVLEANSQLSEEVASTKAALALATLAGAFLFNGKDVPENTSFRQAVLESLIVLPA